MPLVQQDYDQLTTYIKQHIIEWVPQNNALLTFDMQLRDRMTKVEESIQHNTERTIRVEEELKHQRELMQQGFEIMNKRFEEIRQDMDKRFEQVDKRFEQVDKRFEQVDKRFEHVYSFMRWQTGVGFGLLMMIIVKLFLG